MVNTETEALEYFRETLVNTLGDIEYTSCHLHIKRQERMSGFSSRYYDLNGEEQSLGPENCSEICEVIRDLYTITQSQPSVHKDWNKGVFTLYPDGRVNMEYIWDAEWQAELDRLRADYERRKKMGRRKARAAEG
jgi:hypothetical protein